MPRETVPTNLSTVSYSLLSFYSRSGPVAVGFCKAGLGRLRNFIIQEKPPGKNYFFRRRTKFPRLFGQSKGSAANKGAEPQLLYI